MMSELAPQARKLTGMTEEAAHRQLQRAFSIGSISAAQSVLDALDVAQDAHFQLDDAVQVNVRAANACLENAIRHLNEQALAEVMGP